MTTAEYLTARGLRTVKLSSGVSVTIKRPRSLELFRAGLFPLGVSRIDKTKTDPDEYEQMMMEADRNAIRLICECTVEPRVVTRQAKPGELHIEALEPDDFSDLAAAIIAFATENKLEPPQEEHKDCEAHMRNLALACKVFGIDPTKAELWEPERVQRLMEYSILTLRRDGE